MHRKKCFFKVIELMRMKGYCPNCWVMYRLNKSGLKRYYCSECKHTFIVEKDKIILEWYEWDHGRLVLKNFEIDSNGTYWVRAIKYLRTSHKS